MKHLRMLRNFYMPSSIKNLKMFAKIMFVVLIIIRVALYIFQKKIYDQKLENIQNTYSSRTKIYSLTSINSDVHALLTINEDLIF